MWLLPSRGRPANIARFFEAYLATGGTTAGLVLVGPEDIESYSELALPPGWHLRPTFGNSQGDKVREVWAEVKDSPWLGLIGDDCVPETPHWDRALLAGFDDALIVSCDDGWLAPKRAANCWVIRGDLVRAVGYLFPPGMHHLFVDDVWERIGREALCWKCDMAVKVAHRNVLNNAAPVDETHRAAYGSGFSDKTPGPDLTSGFWANDEAAHREWLTQDAVRCSAAACALRATLVKNEGPFLAICTPVADAKPDLVYMQSLLRTKQLLDAERVNNVLAINAQGSHVGKAREHVTWLAMDAGATHLLFIDADMGWEAELVLKMLRADLDFVCAVGVKKKEALEFACNFFPDPQPFDEETGLLEVAEAGFAFVMIKRSVIDRVCAAHPELEYDDEVNGAKRRRWALFMDLIVDRRRLSEDLSFCHRWRALGGKVLVAHDDALVHVGRREYTGKISQLFNIIES